MRVDKKEESNYCQISSVCACLSSYWIQQFFSYSLGESSAINFPIRFFTCSLSLGAPIDFFGAFSVEQKPYLSVCACVYL